MFLKDQTLWSSTQDWTQYTQMYSINIYIYVYYKSNIHICIIQVQLSVWLTDYKNDTIYIKKMLKHKNQNTYVIDTKYNQVWALGYCLLSFTE